MRVYNNRKSWCTTVDTHLHCQTRTFARVPHI